MSVCTKSKKKDIANVCPALTCLRRFFLAPEIREISSFGSRSFASSRAHTLSSFISFIPVLARALDLADRTTLINLLRILFVKSNQKPARYPRGPINKILFNICVSPWDAATVAPSFLSERAKKQHVSYLKHPPALPLASAFTFPPQLRFSTPWRSPREYTRFHLPSSSSLLDPLIYWSYATVFNIDPRSSRAHEAHPGSPSYLSSFTSLYDILLLQVLSLLILLFLWISFHHYECLSKLPWIKNCCYFYFFLFHLCCEFTSIIFCCFFINLQEKNKSFIAGPARAS